MSETGLGPRADQSRADLDDELPVLVEILGDDIDTGHTVIHDPDYIEPPGQYVERTLAEALDIGAEFCCDCFETAWVETVAEE